MYFLLIQFLPPVFCILYILPNTTSFENRITTLQITCSEGLPSSLNIVSTASDTTANPGGCTITKSDLLLEHPQVLSSLAKNTDIILVEKCCEQLKQKLTKLGSRAVFIYNSVINLDLNQTECQQLAEMSRQFHSDASHTHLHQYFNVTVNNVVERGLNSGKVEPQTLTKEWEKYLPFCEEIRTCQAEPSETEPVKHRIS